MPKSTETPAPFANVSVDQAFTLFASPDAEVEERRDALTTLIAAKALPKQAEDPRALQGRDRLIEQAIDAPDAAAQLLAIAESIRLGQVVKRWAVDIGRLLKPAFARELPAMGLLSEADDRLNLARACTQMSAGWLTDYVARSIAEEETGEKARGELVFALLARTTTLAEAVHRLATAFRQVRPDTESPGDTLARRLTRTLAALRSALIESELESGNALGKALYEMIALPLSAVGRPQEDKVQIELSREALLTVHDIVRTRISVVADPEMYRVVAYCRKFFGGGAWPTELKKPLDQLMADMTEALLLLGRQGQCDQGLLGQLDILCNFPERARAVARKLATSHPELPEHVRDWLEHGRVRPQHQTNETAIEAAASSADESIGLVLHAARQSNALGDSLRQPLLSSLELFEPHLVPAVREMLDRLKVLAVQTEQAAGLRRLDLYGAAGEEIEMSAKYFDLVGDAPRQRMIVRQPAIVRRRPDGSIGDVVTKGLVE